MTAPATPALIATCVCCKLDKPVRFSLRLEKVDGNWKTNPVCDKCKTTLIREAKGEGRFIPIFGIEASAKEAAKRNAEAQANRVLVEKYGRPKDRKTVSFSKPLKHRIQFPKAA